jgi:hypothetical protein
MNEILVTYLEFDPEKSDRWRLVNPVMAVLTDGTELIVNEMYVTDFASVPPILWSLIPPIGRYNRAALVHDFLYDRQFRAKELGEYEARKFADLQFLRIANAVYPKGRIRHYIMYKMVRWFGRRAWRAPKE